MTEVFIESARELSRSEVFGYAEADRGRFDFACVLTRDHSRNLIGQTLTHHAAGIDKDLGSLLHDLGGELPVYLYPHEARSEGRVQEFLYNARGRLPDRVELLRLFRYPVFDADNDAERNAVANAIKSQVIDDLLLNVLFGRLSSSDIDFFLNGLGIPGLLMATLNEIAVNGFLNFPTLGKVLNSNPTTLRPRVSTLVAAGMLEQAARGSFYRATPRARVFLRICHLLLRGAMIGAELAFILNRLNLGDGTAVRIASPDDMVSMQFSSEMKRAILLHELHHAIKEFGASFSGEGFLLGSRPDLPEPPGVTWVGR
ncbi:hypothetical protein [Nocardia abscessus]|uniref:hypothetical protein n=1 Tax=Nocardia abscessus TaxID=120957 RepID=UPI002457AAA3|nr:hypothetical protein [Nocardia abscessus]